MRWLDLLFAHWPVSRRRAPAADPAGLEIDTFDGQRVARGRPVPDGGRRRRAFLPAPPGPGAFPELNVRTYVRHGGRGGVWFLSLDAASRLAVEGARAAFHLPYVRARMSSSVDDAGWVRYRSERTDDRAPAATLAARYRPSGPVEPAAPGSLAAVPDRSAAGCTRPTAMAGCHASAIRHAPWPLQPAEADIERNTMATRGRHRAARRAAVAATSRGGSTSWPGGRGGWGSRRPRASLVTGGGRRPAAAARARSARCATSTGRAPSSASSSNTPVAVLVAHQHDDPRRDPGGVRSAGPGSRRSARPAARRSRSRRSAPRSRPRRRPPRRPAARRRPTRRSGRAGTGASP